jgi:hypothetical protein
MTGGIEGVAGGNWPEALVCDQAEDLAGMASWAAFNESRTHRYLLGRSWQPGPVMTFVMLNPSTADSKKDDPTIRRCVRFARREGCGGIEVVNLFALRATDPAELRLHADPVGACNDRVIGACAGGTVVVAWGAHGGYAGRAAEVGRILLAAGIAPVCLGVTANGQPRHPLYVRADAPLVPWRPVGDSPKSTTAREHPPLPGRGQDAAEPMPPAPAAAPDAGTPALAGVRGTQEPASGAAHPVVPLAASPAPGSPPVPGAEGGHSESSPAPARAPAAVLGCGGRGNSLSRVWCEGEAGPGAANPGPALASPLAVEGRAGGDGEAAPAVPSAAGAAKTSVPGGRPGLPGTGKEPAAGARSSAAPVADLAPGSAERERPATALPGQAPRSGQAGRDAWRAAESALAAARRNGRGRYRKKRAGDGFRAAGAVIMPPGSAP